MNLTHRVHKIGCMLFIWYAFMVLIPQIGLLFGLSISVGSFMVASVLFAFFGWFLFKREFGTFNKKDFLETIFWTLIIILASNILATLFIDVSFDGNWYHQDAIYLLKGDWNPNNHILQASETTYCEKYLNHFPKSAWIYASIIFKVTGFIETGKSANWILLFASISLAYSLFKTKFQKSPFESSLWAILFAGNPIVILNLCSFYVDGQMASLLLIGIIFSIEQNYAKGFLSGIMALLAFAIAANLKFTSAVYSGIFVCGLLAYNYIQEKLNLFKLAGIMIAWIVFTFGILGFNPYITNFLRNGHPLYPISEGTNHVFEKEKIYPANFLEMNWAQRFFHGFYAEPSWARNPENSHLKELFGSTQLTVYENGVPDLAGFGPLIPEVFTFLIIAFIFALWWAKKTSKIYLLWLSLIIILSIVINPEAWLLRYVPQFWILIVALLFFVWQHPYLKIVAVLLAFGLLKNNYLLARTYFANNYKRTEKFKSEVEMIKNTQAFDYYYGWTKSSKFRFQTMGLDSNKATYISADDSTAQSFSIGLGAYFKKRTNK